LEDLQPRQGGLQADALQFLSTGHARTPDDGASIGGRAARIISTFGRLPSPYRQVNTVNSDTAETAGLPGDSRATTRPHRLRKLALGGLVAAVGLASAGCASKDPN